MTKATSTPRGRLTRAGLAVGAAAATVLAATTATPAFAAAANVTTTPAAGPAGQATPITITASTPWLYGVPSPVVVFSVIACPLTYTAPSGAPTATTGGILVTDTRKVTDSMLAVTAPATLTNNTTTTLQKYNVCVYNSATASAPNAGKGTYSVGTPPTLTSVTPSSGPTGGGSTVVVSGTDFPTVIGATGIVSATIDGMPLTGLKSISNTAFSGIMPAHSAGKNLTLEVNTAVGTKYLQKAFTYENGLAVSPNTAAIKGGPIDVAVKGSNLLTPTFANGASDTSTGHVYLVEGIYNPLDAGGTVKTNPPVAECTDVLVFTNTDLICRMQLWQRLAAAGTIATPDTRQVTDLVVETGSTTVTSATANFTQADVGTMVAQDSVTTNIAAPLTIVSVSSPTTAVLDSSTGITGAPTTITANIGTSRAATGTLTNTVASNSVTSTVAEFVPADVGKRVTATGGNLPVGTIITSVSSDKMTVTLSRPSVTTVISGLTVFDAAKVPNGAYVVTQVNDGSVGAQLSTSYDQSVVSSSSTFTVANY
ncbi:MAG: IPT/TIG domain-containing protein [Actinomycetota bacterium]|nr:IPT/TIG domain-containing protein [Actinomycetota bacterium]